MSERAFLFHVRGDDGVIHAFGYTDDDTLTVCGLAAGQMPVMLGGDPNCVICRRALEAARSDGGSDDA